MKKIYLFITLFLFFNLAYSQNATLRGFINDKESGEPIIFCNIILEDIKIGASTDINGFFSISKIPPGEHKILITYIGYDTLKENIILKENQLLTKNFELSESSIQIKTVNISADRQAMKSDVKVSVTKVTPKEIALIPAIGGEPDLAQYLQVLPGVVFTGDQGGQLYIRGGSPIQNKVLLDGMIIYNPFHSIGLFSVFDTDLIRNADIYTGGFGAQYGGRISSIMDITTREGNQNRFGGKFSTSTFGSKVLFEGPLFKKGGKSSFIVSGKTSYLDKTSKKIYSYIDSDGLPYSFIDLYGKLTFASKNGSKINLFGFNYNDKVEYSDVSYLGWNSSGFGSKFILIPGSNPVLINGNLAYSKYFIDFKESDNAPRQSGANGFNLGLDFTYFNGDDEFEYGFEILGFRTDYNFTNAVGLQTSQNENTTQLSAFTRYKLKANNLIIEPGIRIHNYQGIPLSFEPRIGAKYILSEKIRFKLAGGKYTQDLVSSTSDRDVVNLFYGFLTSPSLNIAETFQGEDVTPGGLQKANHLIFGLEYDLTNNIDFNVEGYIKNFKQLTNVNREAISNDDFPYIIEKGIAKGIDFVLKYSSEKLYFWAVYSLGDIKRTDEIQTYRPHFDRRHNINLVSTYKFGYKYSWSIDARWNLGSGFPFTQTQGFYNLLTFNNGINSDYVNENGDLGILYGNLNQGRLPFYHRLDISIKKEHEINKNSSLNWNIGITNTYNRANIFYFNRIKYERLDQLPFMPSAGISLSF